MMLGKAIQPEIGQLIEERRFEALREIVADLEIADVAEILDDLPPGDRAIVFRLLPRDRASDVFEHLPFEDQEDLIRTLSQKQIRDILNEMDPDDRTRLLEELPGGVTRTLLRLLKPEELQVARQLLGYPEESIGRLMTPEYIAAKPEWTVQETLDFIRRSAAEAETITYIYLVDEHERLIDDVHLSRLVLADPATRMADVAEENFVALSAFDDQEEAVAMFKKYDRVALPVLDSRGVLLGIVTFDDVMDVQEAESTEDVQLFGGQESLEFAYFETRRIELVRKRVVWLTLLMGGGTLSACVMQLFEGVRAQVLILSALIPMIVASGGNSGSQSASMIVRGLAIKEIDPGDWPRVMAREIGTGLSMGVFLSLVILALLCLGTFIGWIDGSSFVGLAVVVCLSVTLVVTIGSLAGGMMPFLFQRLGFDPAVCSGPFIATFVDVTGILIYLTLAMIILTG